MTNGRLRSRPIHVSLLVDTLGWPGTFPFRAIGPAVGHWSMLRLRGLPEATWMASGNR